MAKKQTTRQAPAQTILEKYADFPGIKVIERRLTDPDGADGLDIRLRDEPPAGVDPQGLKRKWFLRWINTESQGRWHKAINVLGYVAVKLEELQSAEEIAGLAESKDGLVRTGDRGKEVLVKQPLELYTYRKQQEWDRRNRRARNAKLIKAELAEAAGRELGSEAGDTVHGSGFSVEYKEHRSTIGAELE